MHLEPDADPLRHVYATEDADELRAHPRRAVPRRGRQPAVHHRQGHGARTRRTASASAPATGSTRWRCRSWSASSTWRSRRTTATARRLATSGMITANSFMKREFGKKLIEEYIPTLGPDARHRHIGRLHPRPRHADGDPVRPAPRPVATTVRAVLGIRGEPTTPDDPAKGWCGRRSSTRSTSRALRASSSASRTCDARSFSHAPVEHRRWWRGRTEGATRDECAIATLCELCRRDRIRVLSRGEDDVLHDRAATAAAPSALPRQRVVPLVDRRRRPRLAISPSRSRSVSLRRSDGCLRSATLS